MEEHKSIDAIVKCGEDTYISNDLLVFSMQTSQNIQDLLEWVWWHSRFFWDKLSILPENQKADEVIALYNIPEED